MTNHPRGYNPGKFLREWFPEQTKSIPCIVIWTIIFIADAALIFWAANTLGFDILEVSNYNLRTTLMVIYLVIALGLFAIETFIYNKLISLFR